MDRFLEVMAAIGLILAGLFVALFVGVAIAVRIVFPFAVIYLLYVIAERLL